MTAGGNVIKFPSKQARKSRSAVSAGSRTALRDAELAAIWLQEATAALDEAIVRSRDAGASFADIATAVFLSPREVAERYFSARAADAEHGG